MAVQAYTWAQAQSVPLFSAPEERIDGEGDSIHGSYISSSATGRQNPQGGSQTSKGSRSKNKTKLAYYSGSPTHDILVAARELYLVEVIRYGMVYSHKNSIIASDIAENRIYAENALRGASGGGVGGRFPVFKYFCFTRAETKCSMK